MKNRPAPALYGLRGLGVRQNNIRHQLAAGLAIPVSPAVDEHRRKRGPQTAHGGPAALSWVHYAPCPTEGRIGGGA